MIPQLGSEELIRMAKEIPAVPRYILNRYKVPDKYLVKDEDRIQKRPYNLEEIKSLAAGMIAWQPNVNF